jgi:hypothetical protein
MNTIEGTQENIEIDVKRFYVPGVTVCSECYNCGKPKEVNLGADYLSFPVTGKPIPVHFYCGEDACNSVWEVDVILDLKLRLA